MRDKEVSGPSSLSAHPSVPSLSVPLHTFKQQWKARIETAVSSLTEADWLHRTYKWQCQSELNAYALEEQTLSRPHRYFEEEQAQERK